VPLVHTNTTGFLSCWAMPKAMKAAERSSEIVLQCNSGCLVKAKVIGAHLEPGDKIIFLIPLWAQMAARSIICWMIKVLLLNEFSDNITFQRGLLPFLFRVRVFRNSCSSIQNDLVVYELGCAEVYIYGGLAFNIDRPNKS